ncbi:MAG: redoxin domain-containing protein [Saprospiraceae bacterium]|nr:redoxin domain-containing protein [Bacteroidia bacterium]NNE15432.1 redoxin domain-containing protein [Saprospiraceae bacterium]NNL93557.1 redoxin domain-containing protein [Saprospiraceae bacterium]
MDLQNVFTNSHESLGELSQERPVVLIFLRHFGCIFCREALHDIAEKQDKIEANNAKLVFVHMAENDIADHYFKEYGLKGVSHISNPSCSLYAEFGLSKGTFGQLFGLKTWIRGYQIKKKGIEGSLKQIGDSLQMPGIFILFDNKIVDSYIHKNASDRPDYDKLIACCEIN